MYLWTEVLMREARDHMWGLSLHMYTWTHARAVEFDEAGWFKCLKRALWMDDLIVKHSEIMDRTDPEKKVGLVVDEWGTWHKGEEGSNPGFLYQQNTLRDALVAGVTLNLFNNHADRVRMANLAQMINVLQAVILTDGSKMVLTPTYHVFDLYAAHQGATLLPVTVQCETVGPADQAVPQVSASASRDGSGAVHLTLCNLDPNRTVEVTLSGELPGTATGRVLTAGSMAALNTFELPGAVATESYRGAVREPGGWRLSLPARSVVALTLQP
jgi:alpha-N-arabinofuranosidase